VPHTFDSAVVDAILHHMNDDHTDDNLLIARAFAPTDAGDITAATMIGVDGDGGTWSITLDGAESELRILWPGGPITERAAVRREVVALYDAACERLGITPRPHD
jgi:hypothetical protein